MGEKAIKEITLSDAQKTVNKWIETYGIRYFSELTNLAILMEEVGELARIISRKYGDQSFKIGERGEKEDMADELSDILWVVISLANQTNINLTEAFTKNIEKKTKRDFNRHINNEKLR